MRGARADHGAVVRRAKRACEAEGVDRLEIRRLAGAVTAGKNRQRRAEIQLRRRDTAEVLDLKGFQYRGNGLAARN
jgi:hypothetical protein